MFKRTLLTLSTLTLLAAIILPASSFALSLPSNHQLWDTGADIHDLQVWLNSNGYPLAASGPGSPGQETNLFGRLTYAAVTAFQTANNLSPTGYMGTLSRSILDSLATTTTATKTTGSNMTQATNAELSLVTTATSTPVCDAPAGLTCYPGTAIIKPYTPGNGYTPGFGGSSNPAPTPAPTPPPAPTPYVAQAVHFDGSTWLRNPALALSPDPVSSFSSSFWIKTLPLASSTEVYIGIVDPENTFATNISLDPPNSSTPNDIFFTLGHIPNLQVDSTDVTDNHWHHVLESADVSLGIAKIYIDDVDVTTALGIFDGNAPFAIPFNGLSYWVGSDGFGDAVNGDIADFWIAPGQSLLDSNGDISTSTRQKFIGDDGKPVYLGANGELPTGTAPAVFLSGDSNGFVTNKGTGGAFTETGALVDASSSPSDGLQFDPAKLGTNDALSNNNLTVTCNIPFVSGATMTTVFKSTGKYFYSVHVDNNQRPGADDIRVGVATAAQNLSNDAGSDGTNSLGWSERSDVTINDATLSTIDTYATDDTVDVAVDLGAKLFWGRVNGGNWNANPTADPATGTGGISMAGISVPLAPAVTVDGFSPFDAVTANFGATPYTYSAPAGFSNWPLR